MEVVGILWALILTILEWVWAKFANLGVQLREPLSGAWAVVGLGAIWLMHLKTRQRVTDLSKQVALLQGQLVQMERRLRGSG